MMMESMIRNERKGQINDLPSADNFYRSPPAQAKALAANERPS